MNKTSHFVNEWKSLVAAAKENPNQIVNHLRWAIKIPAGELRAKMVERLHQKISEHDPRAVAYRRSIINFRQHNPHAGTVNAWRYEMQATVFKKYTDASHLYDYESDRYDLMQIRKNRKRVYQWRTKFFQRKFAHLLAQYWD